MFPRTIFARAGLGLPRSTLAQWVGTCGVRLQPLVDALKAEILTRRVLHADETPVQMLKPGKGASHRAYLWAYAPGRFEDMKGVVCDFCESRSGEHARNFLGDWLQPIAIGRSNWLFAGSLRAGQRAAAVMSLVQSARMNGHDPYAHLKDVLTWLPTHRASRVEELPPHRWQAASA